MTETDEYPEFAARFYDAIYDRIRSGIDHEYFLSEMRAAAGPVLEVGVGTGRMFHDALDAGVDVYGIDVSEAMLRVLRSKLTDEQWKRIRIMDVRRLQLGRKFELIVAPFRVFSHLLDVEDQLTALKAIAAHLTNRGRFIFDLFSPNYAMLAGPHKRQLDFDGAHAQGETLRRYSRIVNHPATQINDVTFDFEWTEDGREHRASWTFPMRYYFRYELEHLVARSGLELVALYGDYAGSRITDATKDFVLVCRKPPGCVSPRRKNRAETPQS